MKILVTGGAGFIGYRVAESLASQGHHVQIFDNFSRGQRDAQLEALLSLTNVGCSDINLMNANDCEAVTSDYDVIFHLAAIVGVRNVVSQPYDVLWRNTVMLHNVISIAKRQRSLKKVVFASTSEAYSGTLEAFDVQIPTPEDVALTIADVARPRTSYLLSKIVGEALCHYADLPFTIIRPHNIYGPRMGMAHVIPELLRKIHKADDGSEIEIASVDQTRSFCFVSDAIDLMQSIAFDGRAAGMTFNVGSQAPEVTINRLTELCMAVVGKKLRIVGKTSPSGSPARRAPDMSKATQMFGYRPKISLENGIQQTYDWYVANDFGEE